MRLRHLGSGNPAIRASAGVAALVLLLGLWARHLNVGPGTVPIYDPQARSFWLAGLALVVVSGIAFHVIDRGGRDAEGRMVPGSRARLDAAPEFPTMWIVPAISTLAVVMLLDVYHSWGAIIGASGLAFLLLFGAHELHGQVLSLDDDVRLRAQLIYNILIHVVAFLILSMIYINKLRSLFSATAVLVVVAALLLALTDGEDAEFVRRVVYALVGAVLLGEVTWVLNYWEAIGWTGGAVLLIFFYLASGLIVTQIRQGVRRRDVLEYGGISAILFGVVVASVLG